MFLVAIAVKTPGKAPAPALLLWEEGVWLPAPRCTWGQVYGQREMKRERAEGVSFYENVPSKFLELLEGADRAVGGAVHSWAPVLGCVGSDQARWSPSPHRLLLHQNSLPSLPAELWVPSFDVELESPGPESDSRPGFAGVRGFPLAEGFPPDSAAGDTEQPEKALEGGVVLESALGKLQQQWALGEGSFGAG